MDTSIDNNNNGKYNYNYNYGYEIYCLTHLFHPDREFYRKCLHNYICRDDTEKYKEGAIGWVNCFKGGYTSFSKPFMLHMVKQWLKDDVDASKIPYLDEIFLDIKNYDRWMDTHNILNIQTKSSDIDDTNDIDDGDSESDDVNYESDKIKYLFPIDGTNDDIRSWVLKHDIRLINNKIVPNDIYMDNNGNRRSCWEIKQKIYQMKQIYGNIDSNSIGSTRIGSNNNNE